MIERMILSRLEFRDNKECGSMCPLYHHGPVTMVKIQ